jgi:hypothetical protein
MGGELRFLDSRAPRGAVRRANRRRDAAASHDVLYTIAVRMSHYRAVMEIAVVATQLSHRAPRRALQGELPGNRADAPGAPPFLKRALLACLLACPELSKSLIILYTLLWQLMWRMHRVQTKSPRRQKLSLRTWTVSIPTPLFISRLRTHSRSVRSTQDIHPEADKRRGERLTYLSMTFS